MTFSKGMYCVVSSLGLMMPISDLAVEKVGEPECFL
jgi:hypothetical protein